MAFPRQQPCCWPGEKGNRVASTSRRKRPPNADLARLIETCGASHKSLALRVNQLAKHAGMETDYSHTSLANWCQRGMIPKWPVPTFLAQALGERLGRPVSLSEIGMGDAETPDADVGLDFPRDRADAVRVATSFWSFVNRRDFLTGSGFAVSAFTTPVTRWLVTPADEAADLAERQAGRQGGPGRTQGRGRRGPPLGLQIRRRELEGQLRHRLPSGAGRPAAAGLLLRQRRPRPVLRHRRAVPARGLDGLRRRPARCRPAALHPGTPPGPRWRRRPARLLCADHHGHAVAAAGLRLRGRRYGPGRLRTLEGPGRPSGAGVHQADRGPRSCPRGMPGPFPRALAASEDLLGQADAASGSEPAWIDFYHHARLSADAAEVFRDLKNPKAALAWNQRAAAMPSGVFTRSVGMRLAIVGTAHLQARDLDQGLDLGNRSVDILARVQSSRAKDYVREFNTALAPWRREAGRPRVHPPHPHRTRNRRLRRLFPSSRGKAPANVPSRVRLPRAPSRTDLCAQPSVRTGSGSAAGAGREARRRRLPSFFFSARFSW